MCKILNCEHWFNYICYPFVNSYTTDTYKVFLFRILSLYWLFTTITLWKPILQTLWTQSPRLDKQSDQDSLCLLPGRVAQSVTCLATDACLTAIPGVASSIPAQSHTLVEIDHEIISTVILLPSADSFKKGCCQLQAKVCARITGYLFKPAQEKVWLGELTVPQ